MDKSILTFRQYLQENSDGWTSRYKRRTAEEIQTLPTLSPSNADAKFRVGNIVFDQENGMGAVPWNQEVMYKGFVAMMKPSSFLSFTTPMEHTRERIERTAALLKEGVSVGSPWLSIDFDGPKTEETGLFFVVGHEGRARAAAIALLQPTLEIPIHIFVYQGNHKYITPEMIQNLNSSICRERTQVPVQNKISKIILQRKLITL